MQSNSPPSSQNTLQAQDLAQEAIMAALAMNWQDAIKLNKKILKTSKEDVEALNRLARAYNCLKEYKKTARLYKKVLNIDPFNIIALKNLEKITKYDEKADKENSNSDKLKPTNSNGQTAINLSRIFLDEPGRTKIVSLLNLAPPSILATLNCGDSVVLTPKNHSVAVHTHEGMYLGAFPDDLAHRILSFISGGNQYEAYVKKSTIRNLSIFIRETFRASRFSNQPSFQVRVNVFEG